MTLFHSIWVDFGRGSGKMVLSTHVCIWMLEGDNPTPLFCPRRCINGWMGFADALSHAPNQAPA